jgi:4-hydroxybenzoate polyprenyltransferase
MKEGGVGEKTLKILLGIVGLGVLLVCILGVLFSIPELDKLDWFLVGVGLASVFWYIYHIKYTKPARYEAMMKELRGKTTKQDRE